MVCADFLAKIHRFGGAHIGNSSRDHTHERSPERQPIVSLTSGGVEGTYKEKQEEFLEKPIQGPRGGASWEMWRILVLGVLKQGLRFRPPAQSCEPSRGRRRLGHSDFADKALRASDNCRRTCRCRPETGHAVKKAWRASCAGGVTRSDVHYPRFEFYVLAANGIWASRGSIRCASTARQAPEKVETYLGLCRDLASGPKGPSRHWSGKARNAA